MSADSAYVDISVQRSGRLLSTGEPNPHPTTEQFRMTRGVESFKGNKRHLPTKPCAICGRPMTWRKKWTKNWDDVKYCSDACRRSG